MDDDALLAAIAQAPDDPGPRLVYADVLVARGDPHGELIIVQNTAPTEQLRFRERELVEAVKERIGPPANGATFRRGFVDSIDVSPFLPPILARAFVHPAMRFVTGVTVHENSSAVHDALLAAPFLRGVRRLGGVFSPERLLSLTVAIAALDELSISSDVLGPHLFVQWLPLRRLAIRSFSPVAPDDLAPILWGDAFPELRHLALDAPHPSARILEILVASPLLPRLESLAMDWGALGDTIAAHREAFAHVKLVGLRRQPVELCDLGNVLLRLGRRAEALPLFEEAYLRQSRYAPASEGLARALGGQVDAAKPELDRDPVHLDLLVDLVTERRRRGENDAAERALDRVLAADPERAGAWTDRMIARLATGDDDGAIAALARALAADPDHLSKSEHARADDRDVRAIAAAHVAFLRDPTSAIDVLQASATGAETAVRESMHLHAAILSALSNLALGRIWASTATLDALDARMTCPRTWAIANLARGFIEHARGHQDTAIAIWTRAVPPTFDPLAITLALAEQAKSVHSGEGEPYDQLGCTIVSAFAALLADMSESARARIDAAGSFPDRVGPLRTTSNMILTPILAHATRALPDVDLSELEELLDGLVGHFRGDAPSWRRCQGLGPPRTP